MGEFDSNPVAKSLKAYHDARARGASDGSMAGNLGVADVRREREAQRKKESSSSSSSSSKSDNSSKVICTELHRQGLMSHADYLLCAQHAREHLTERHFRGYHAWALPVVRHMRRSKRATAFWRRLAAARADHLAHIHGDSARKNRLGALLCAIGHPICYALGWAGQGTGNSQWQVKKASQGPNLGGVDYITDARLPQCRGGWPKKAKCKRLRLTESHI